MTQDSRRAWAKTLEGRVLSGRYRIGSLIGLGGMGAVFAGENLEVERAVAIKTLVPGAFDDAQVARLRREARQAARVGGRGVVEVFDFGLDNESGPYLVMELLTGQTLEAKIHEHPEGLPVARALDVAQALLTTLAAVHAEGLIHRDLKPANVFLASTAGGAEAVKILDFGLARPIERGSGETVTRSGEVIGTPRFMAPEQADSEAAIDARVDVYAMGAILYTLLAGQRPYSWLGGEDALAAVRAGPPQPLADLRSGLPTALVEVVETAMARAAGDRYADGRAMGAALRRARAGFEPGALEPEPSIGTVTSTTPNDTDPESSRPDRSSAPRPKRRWKSWTLAAAAALTALGALTWTWLTPSQSRRAPPSPAPVAAETEVETVEQPAIAPVRETRREAEAAPPPDSMEPPDAVDDSERRPRPARRSTTPRREPWVEARSGDLTEEDF